MTEYVRIKEDLDRHLASIPWAANVLWLARDRRSFRLRVEQDSEPASSVQPLHDGSSPPIEIGSAGEAL